MDGRNVSGLAQIERVRLEALAPYVLVDEILVTGQNPASSAPAADELLMLLRT